MLSTAAYYDRPEDCMDHLKQNFAGIKGFEVDEVIICDCSFIGFLNGRCVAMLAFSHEREIIAISFRGTTDGQQLLDEVLSTLGTPKKSLAHGRGKVQKYFANAYSKLGNCLHDRLKALIAKYPGYKVAVCGHSLGGAIASIAAYTLVANGYVDKKKIKLYTYGMPRVGDKRYAEHHDELVPESWRLVHFKDCIPHFPTCAGSCTTTGDDSPFHHRAEVFYDVPSMSRGSRYKVCHGNEDSDCSHIHHGAIASVWNALECDESHRKYFGIPVGTYCEEELGPSRNKDSLKDAYGIDGILATDECAVLVKKNKIWVVSHWTAAPRPLTSSSPSSFQ